MKALEACNLRKSYWNRSQRLEAVRSVSLAIAPGEVLAFLGPNGAGKTTTIKMIAGLIWPDEGWVRIAGRDPYRDPQALGMLGAVLEGNRNLYWRLTPEENLEYFGMLKGLDRRTVRQRSRELLEQFGLLDKGRTPVQALSRGMQQKLAIAVALVHRPRLMLLDEPTLGLDVEATETVKALVRQIAQKGQAILLTTHQLQVAEALADRVAIIRKGEIVAEAPTPELIQQFSSGTYVIEMAVAIDPERVKHLENLGAAVEGQVIRINNPEILYLALATLKPLPLLRVIQEQADLTEIFLKLVGNAESFSG